MSTHSIFLLRWRDWTASTYTYDCNTQAVVIATSEEEARSLMQERTADEGLFVLHSHWYKADRDVKKALFEAYTNEARLASPFWMSDDFSSCEVVGTATEELRSGVLAVVFSSI